MIELKINSPKHGIFTILYSDEDRSLISKYTWTIHKTKWGVYARTGNSKIGTIPMHRMIMGCPDSFVDHINRNTLDNRRDNLRVVTITQSNINKDKSPKSNTPYKGVSYDKHIGKYRVRVSIGRKQYFGGYYNDTKEAAKKYNELALKYHGEFAVLNQL